MGYTKKTNNNVSKVTETKAVEEKVADKVEKVVETKQRVFEAEELIPCRSMVSGRLFIKGVRSNILYTFADYNDVCEIEYRDLIYMCRSSNNKFIYEPMIIIDDEDFVAQNSKVADLYASMYTNGDLIDIISLPTSQMIEVISTLPSGCQETLKGIISTMIDNGTLDSVQKIKALDELFGTNMLLTLVQE